MSLSEGQRLAKSRATRSAAREGAKFGAFLAACGLAVGAIRILGASDRISALPSPGALLLGAVGYVLAFVVGGAVLSAVRVRYLSEFMRGLAWAAMGVLAMMLMGLLMRQQLFPMSVGGVLLGLVFGYACGAIQLSDSERARANDGW